MCMSITVPTRAQERALLTLSSHKRTSYAAVPIQHEALTQRKMSSTTREPLDSDGNLMASHIPTGGPSNGPARERALLALTSHLRTSYADIPIDYGSKAPFKMPPSLLPPSLEPASELEVSRQLPETREHSLNGFTNPDKVDDNMIVSLMTLEELNCMESGFGPHNSRAVTDP